MEHALWLRNIYREKVDEFDFKKAVEGKTRHVYAYVKDNNGSFETTTKNDNLSDWYGTYEEARNAGTEHVTNGFEDTTKQLILVDKQIAQLDDLSMFCLLVTMTMRKEFLMQVELCTL